MGYLPQRGPLTYGPGRYRQNYRRLGVPDQSFVSPIEDFCYRLIRELDILMRHFPPPVQYVFSSHSRALRNILGEFSRDTLPRPDVPTTGLTVFRGAMLMLLDQI